MRKVGLWLLGSLLLVHGLVMISDSAERPAWLKIVFVSSQAYQGNLGGLTGADAKCQSLAVAAGLLGTYRAWLSDNTQDARSRFDPYRNTYMFVDGTLVAQHLDITAMSPDALVQPINLTEDGWRLDDAQRVWTGSYSQGKLSTLSCHDWTSNSPDETGLAGHTGSGLLEREVTWCHITARLFCFEE